jgi:hypothetical protein
MSDASAVQYSLIVTPPLATSEIGSAHRRAGLGEETRECGTENGRLDVFLLRKVREAMVL